MGKIEYQSEILTYASRLGEEVVIDVLAKAVRKNSRKIAESILKNFNLKIVIKSDAKGEWQLFTGAEKK